MKHLLRSHHPVRHIKSFKYAFEGIFHALLHEPNFRIQISIAILSIGLGFYYKISTTEWGILILSLGALLSAEMLNTLVEEFIDIFIKDQRPGVKVIKDIAAGFVLLTAVTTSVIIFLIFYQTVLGQ